jgi:WD40 repeat protein
LDSNNLIRKLEGHTNWVYGLIPLENGCMASGSSDSKIRIWNVNDGRSIKTINNIGSIWTMIKANGWLITAGYDNIIRIWNIEESKLVKSLEGHKDSIWALK